jgi:hypothetical protein
MIRTFLLSAILVAGAIAGNAQPNVGCNDKAMRLEAAQLKENFKIQGMDLYRDAMLTMQSQEPSPVAVQLEKGKMYQMIFVGSHYASKMNFELFDGNDKRIDKVEVPDPKQKNYIVYSFVPEKSDVYLVVLSQKYKSKSFCGSFTIMEKSTNPDKK